jgi:hypothetical protein
MNTIGYQVVNLGTRELLHGWETFRERRDRARFEFLSANIVWQDTGEPVLPPTTVRTLSLRAGAKTRELRVGFIGLVKNDPAFRKESADGRRIVTIDPYAAAEKHAAALRPKTDLIVALVALELEQARTLPKRAKEIDLVLGGVGGHMTRTDDFPEDTRIGRARIFAIGDQGKNVGEVRLVLGAQRTIVSNQRHIIALGREWPDEPVLARLMDTTRIAINEYHKAQAEALSPFATAAAVKPAGIPAAGPPPPARQDEPAYTGSGRCAACHEEAHGIWARSGHAHAFDTLVRASQDYNPKCVGCHTVGFGREGGFVNVRVTPGLTHVQCESCHGPSSHHPETVVEGYGRTNVDFCRTCHTGENSPDYNPPEYIPRVRHWADGAGR